MNKGFLRDLPMMTLCLSLAALPLWGQEEKVLLNMSPKPDQTLYYKMVQEMDFDTEHQTALGSPVKMQGKTVVSFSQKTGKPDSEGRFETEFVCDAAEMFINDAPMSGSSPWQKVLGKKIIAVYDVEGKITDVKLPSDLGMPPDALKQWLISFHGNLPKAFLGIGESVDCANLDCTPGPRSGRTWAQLGGADDLQAHRDRQGWGRSPGPSRHRHEREALGFHSLSEGREP